MSQTLITRIPVFSSFSLLAGKVLDKGYAPEQLADPSALFIFNCTRQHVIRKEGFEPFEAQDMKLWGGQEFVRTEDIPAARLSRWTVLKAVIVQADAEGRVWWRNSGCLSRPEFAPLADKLTGDYLWSGSSVIALEMAENPAYQVFSYGDW